MKLNFFAGRHRLPFPIPANYDLDKKGTAGFIISGTGEIYGSGEGEEFATRSALIGPRPYELARRLNLLADLRSKQKEDSGRGQDPRPVPVKAVGNRPHGLSYMYAQIRVGMGLLRLRKAAVLFVKSQCMA